MSGKNVNLSEKYKMMKVYEIDFQDYQDKNKERSLLKEKMIEKVKTNLPPLSK